MKKSFDLSITSSLLLIMCAFVFVAKFSAWQSSSLIQEVDLVEEIVSVEVLGAVKKPGSYMVAVGTPIKEVMKKARPKPLADLQNIDLKENVVGQMTIEVAELKEVVVRVEGAVEPVELRLPAGSRISDLKTKVSLKGADPKFFKKKRMLKNGEVLEVPNKRT